MAGLALSPDQHRKKTCFDQYTIVNEKTTIPSPTQEAQRDNHRRHRRRLAQVCNQVESTTSPGKRQSSDRGDQAIEMTRETLMACASRRPSRNHRTSNNMPPPKTKKTYNERVAGVKLDHHFTVNICNIRRKESPPPPPVPGTRSQSGRIGIVSLPASGLWTVGTCYENDPTRDTLCRVAVVAHREISIPREVYHRRHKNSERKGHRRQPRP